MKTFLFSLLFYAAMGCSMTTPTQPLPINNDESNKMVSVKVDFITIKPCINGYSAKLRVGLLAKKEEGTFLVASQHIHLPCMEVQQLNRQEFDTYAIEKKQDEQLSSVVDYLNKQDEDGQIFEEVSLAIFDRLNGFDKKMKAAEDLDEKR